jgi:hypothetical protein
MLHENPAEVTAESLGAKTPEREQDTPRLRLSTGTAMGELILQIK